MGILLVKLTEFNMFHILNLKLCWKIHLKNKGTVKVSGVEFIFMCFPTPMFQSFSESVPPFHLLGKFSLRLPSEDPFTACAGITVIRVPPPFTWNTVLSSNWSGISTLNRSPAYDSLHREITSLLQNLAVTSYHIWNSNYLLWPKRLCRLDLYLNFQHHWKYHCSLYSSILTFLFIEHAVLTPTSDACGFPLPGMLFLKISAWLPPSFHSYHLSKVTHSKSFLTTWFPCYLFALCFSDFLLCFPLS